MKQIPLFDVNQKLKWWQRILPRMFGKRLPHRNFWLYLFRGKVYVLGEKEGGT